MTDNVVQLPTPAGDEYEQFNPGDHAGQLRMAYYMAKWYGAKLLYVDVDKWHFWDGTRWKQDKVGQASRLAQATLKRAINDAFPFDTDDKKQLAKDVRKCSGTAAGVDGMLKIASTNLAFVRELEQLDADPYLLNVANGTVDLHTLKLRDWNPADCITKIATAAYHPDARSELWETLLERVLPDEDVRKYLQRVVGMALIGEIRAHILVIIYGTGRNGKGVVYEAIMHALGDYADEADPDLLTQHEGSVHPTNKMDLRGKRFVVISETEERKRMNVNLMKQLTGNTYIKGRKMRQDFERKFRASHTPFMVTNHKPAISAGDIAAWERVRVIPFDVYIPQAERDDELGNKLELHADAVLTWAIDGLKDYLEHGLQTPDAVLASTEKYQHENDEVAQFVGDECLAGAEAGVKRDAWANTTELHSRYINWRRGQRYDSQPLGRNQFGKELDRLGHVTLEGGRRERQGIALNLEAESELETF